MGKVGDHPRRIIAVPSTDPVLPAPAEPRRTLNPAPAEPAKTPEPAR